MDAPDFPPEDVASAVDAWRAILDHFDRADAEDGQSPDEHERGQRDRLGTFLDAQDAAAAARRRGSAGAG